MKVSLEWLAEYVALPAPAELADRLTMAGLEVEGIDDPSRALAGVVVAQIKESVQHPNADKLSVTKVDAGGEPLQIVCGAKNYKVGDKVPLATVGTKLPNGVEIKKAALRGVESFGMLCSQKELGLAEDASGLYILDPGLKPGTPIAKALGLENVVFELNVTPNRPDALSHLGVAREVGAITGKPVKPPAPALKESGTAASDKIKIRIEDPSRCPRYAARVIEGVKIGPSPAWLSRRLEACGVRSINNVVDVTNYVLLEYGQPLHGFDLDRLSGPEIVVRCAKKGEKLTTLDGKERTLDPDDLLICDRDKPQVLAGVMGGATSEVSDATTRILLESANFQPATVRRSSKRHGLHTESSHRFERGADVDAVPLALDRAAALIAELGGGTVLKGRVDVYPKPAPPTRVTLRYERVGALLGVESPAAESRRILESLGLKVEGENTFVIPKARVDIEREEDLIEEIARVRGYDAIPAALPASSGELSPEPASAEADRRIRLALSSSGFDEVINYSFVAPKDLEALGVPGEIPVRNPLSVEQSMMRTSLAAGLLQDLSRNLRHQVDSVRLYESGRTYHRHPGKADPKGPPVREVARVGGVIHGRRHGRTWAFKDESADFYDAKAAVESLLAALGIAAATYRPAEGPHLHPRATAEVVVNGKPLGLLGQIHPRVAKAFDVPAETYLFELEVDRLVAVARLVPQYKAPPKFPAVLRDIAVVVDQERSSEEIRDVIVEVGRPLIEGAALFDVYTGKPIPEGRKNLAFALRYRSPERTLTDEEVNQAHARIVEEVQRRLGGNLRT